MHTGEHRLGLMAEIEECLKWCDENPEPQYPEDKPGEQRELLVKLLAHVERAELKVKAPKQPMTNMCVVDEDQSWAPCCYIICQVDEQGNWDERDEATTVLVQTDWDWPSLASNLGYVACECGYTDGTVDCEHKTASEMIAAAGEFLDAHLGEQFEDPGYFGDE